MAKVKTEDLIDKIVNQPDNSPPDTLLRLECIKVASVNYRRSDELIRQASELMSYIKTGATS